MGHPSCYAAIVTALSLTYLYCGKYSKKEKAMFLLMLLVGIASGRSKFYGFYALSIFMIFYLGKIENLKFDFKNTTALLLLLVAMAFVAREKLDLYFVQGLSETESEEKDLLARFVLYATSFKLFVDYLPFGTGLASFGTHASGVYYSNIYTKYGIDSVSCIIFSWKSVLIYDGMNLSPLLFNCEPVWQNNITYHDKKQDNASVK